MKKSDNINNKKCDHINNEKNDKGYEISWLIVRWHTSLMIKWFNINNGLVQYEEKEWWIIQCKIILFLLWGVCEISICKINNKIFSVIKSGRILFYNASKQSENILKMCPRTFFIHGSGVKSAKRIFLNIACMSYRRKHCHSTRRTKNKALLLLHTFRVPIKLDKIIFEPLSILLSWAKYFFLILVIIRLTKNRFSCTIKVCSIIFAILFKFIYLYTTTLLNISTILNRG